MSRFSWAILTLAIFLLGLGWIVASQETAASSLESGGLTEAPIAGYLAPDFRLQNIQGQEVSLADYRGQPVVLNFWATWCPPCRAEVPHFQDAARKYNGQAAILGIDQGEPLAVVADFAATYGLTYPLLLDPSNVVNRDYGVAALPTTIFVGFDGVIREVYTGIINKAVLEDRVERLLAEG